MSQMPDKIWLHKDTKYSTADEVFGYQYEFAQEIQDSGIENFVEYVPKDAFIEKACAFLKDRIAHDSIDYPMATNSLIEDFKKYMEE